MPMPDIALIEKKYHKIECSCYTEICIDIYIYMWLFQTNPNIIYNIPWIPMISNNNGTSSQPPKRCRSSLLVHSKTLQQVVNLSFPASFWGFAIWGGFMRFPKLWGTPSHHPNFHRNFHERKHPGLAWGSPSSTWETSNWGWVVC